MPPTVLCMHICVWKLNEHSSNYSMNKNTKDDNQMKPQFSSDFLSELHITISKTWIAYSPEFLFD